MLLTDNVATFNGKIIFEIVFQLIFKSYFNTYKNVSFA